MIEETALPNPASAASDGGSYNAFQSPNPSPQFKIKSSADEEMNVIGHDDITTQSESAFDALLTKVNQDGVNHLVCQYLASVLCA